LIFKWRDLVGLLQPGSALLFCSAGSREDRSCRDPVFVSLISVGLFAPKSSQTAGPQKTGVCYSVFKDRGRQVDDPPSDWLRQSTCRSTKVKGKVQPFPLAPLRRSGKRPRAADVVNNRHREKSANSSQHPHFGQQQSSRFLKGAPKCSDSENLPSRVAVPSPPGQGAQEANEFLRRPLPRPPTRSIRERPLRFRSR
jgi:hypothetical protein